MSEETFYEMEVTDSKSIKIDGERIEFEKGDVIYAQKGLCRRLMNDFDVATKTGEVEEREGVESRISTESVDKDTCDVEKSNGEVCGREKPCSYHSEDGDEEHEEEQEDEDDEAEEEEE